jgi:WD40 repeat protein
MKQLILLFYFQFCTATSNNRLKVYSTKPEIIRKDREKFSPLNFATQVTNGCVTCFDRLVGENALITGTSNGQIAAYEFHSSRLETSYKLPNAHAYGVTGISSSKDRKNVWISTSYDKNCLIWDKSQLRPASALIENHKCTLMSVVWFSEFSVIVGDANGNLLMVDTRMPKSLLNEYHASNRGIEFICCNEKTDKFGVKGACNEVKIVKVNDSGNFEETHQFSTETKIVYSMCWDSTDDDAFYVVGSEKLAKKLILTKV